MTPKERAKYVVKDLVEIGPSTGSTAWLAQVEDLIAGAIRDAVAEAEKAAFQKARTAAAIEGGQAITPMLDQARAALEPFARAYSRYGHSDTTDQWQLNAHTGLYYFQLRAARDAYLALGEIPALPLEAGPEER